MATYTSIGTNSSITSATPSSCAGEVVYFGGAVGVHVGDKATCLDEGTYAATFIYRVTAVSGSTVTLKFVEEDSFMWGNISPCNLTDMMGAQADILFSRFYNDPNAWQQDLGNSDIYGSGDDAVGECHNDSVWTNSSHFVGVSSLGTLASIKLTVHPDSRHSGTPGTGARYQHSGTSAVAPITVGCNNFTLEWLCVSGSNATGMTTAVEISSGATLNVIVQNMVIDNVDPSGDASSDRYGIKIIGANASLPLPSGSIGRVIRNNFVTRIGAGYPATGNSTGIGQSDTNSTGGANCYHNTVSVTSYAGNAHAFYLSPASLIVNNLAYQGIFKITDDSSGNSSSSHNFSQSSSSAGLGSAAPNGTGARSSSHGTSISSSTNPALALGFVHWYGTTPPTTQPHGYSNACVEAGVGGYTSGVDIFGDSWVQLWDIGCDVENVKILVPGPATCIASTVGEYQSAATAIAVTVSPLIAIVPDAITANAVTVSPPTVILPDISVTPSPATADAVTVSPSVILESITVTVSAATANANTFFSVSTTAIPSAATADAATVSPATVILNSFSITPSPATADAGIVAPTVVSNFLSFSMTPSAVTAESQTSQSITFKIDGFTAVAADAGTLLGNVSLATFSGFIVTADIVTVSPTVIVPSISVIPFSATTEAITISPLLTLGSVIVTVSAATANAATISPTTIAGSFTLTPSAITANADTPSSFGVTLSVLSITAEAMTSSSFGVMVSGFIATANASTSGGDVLVRGFSITASAGSINPTVVLGSISVGSLTSASINASTPSPTVIQGSLSVTTPFPSTTTAEASTGDFGYSSILITPAIVTGDARTSSSVGILYGSLSFTPSISTGNSSTTSPTVSIGPPVVVTTNPATADTGVYIPTIVPFKATTTARAIIDGMIFAKIIIAKVPSLLKPAATDESFIFPKGDVLSITEPIIDGEFFSYPEADTEAFTEPALTTESLTILAIIPED